MFAAVTKYSVKGNAEKTCLRGKEREEHRPGGLELTDFTPHYNLIGRVWLAPLYRRGSCALKSQMSSPGSFSKDKLGFTSSVQLDEGSIIISVFRWGNWGRRMVDSSINHSRWSPSSRSVLWCQAACWSGGRCASYLAHTRQDSGELCAPSLQFFCKIIPK